jgi:hypothetical protein
MSRENRLPAAYWFNPNCENQIAYGRPGYTPTRLTRELAIDLASLPMFLSAPEDLVLVPRRPSPGFLDKLGKVGFPIPEFVEYSSGDLSTLEFATRPLSALQPWGWSPESAAFLEPLHSLIQPLWNDRIRQLYSKVWSADLLATFLRQRKEEWLCDESTVGVGCANLEEATRQIARLHSDGVAELLVKGVFGSSGQNQLRLSTGQPRPEQIGWLRNILEEQGCVVVEPRLDKRLDLSIHLDIVEPGRAEMIGWTRFLTDRRGQYRGAFVRGALEDLGPELREFPCGNPNRLQPFFRELADHVADGMTASGYIGPVGIDALIYRAADPLRLKPIVEINPRFTMGRVALEMERRVHPERTALWLTLSDREIRSAGFPDIGSFASHFEDRYPPIREKEDARLSTGVLFTTDPSTARAFATVLLVGGSLEMCASYFQDFSGKLRETIGSILCSPTAPL